MKQKKKESLIIIISAPSGSGKTTIVDELLKELPDIKRSISFTTRDIREGEQDGTDYLFISKEEFQKKIDENEMLEYEENFGHFYGTSKKQFHDAKENGEDIILCIDVKGAKNVAEEFPSSISIFIMPPSEEELKKRLKNRKTEDAKQVETRLKEAQAEIEVSGEYDYMIINRDIKEAVSELKTIIENERKNRIKMGKKVR